MTREKIKIDEKKVFDLASQGLNQGMIAQGLGIHRDTFNNRLNDNPLISAAYKNGKDSAIQVVENSLFTQAISGKSVVATIFYLKNANPSKYRDVHEVNHSGSLAINVNSLAAPIEGEYIEVNDSKG